MQKGARHRVQERAGHRVQERAGHRVQERAGHRVQERSGHTLECRKELGKGEVSRKKTMRMHEVKAPAGGSIYTHICDLDCSDFCTIHC